MKRGSIALGAVLAMLSLHAARAASGEALAPWFDRIPAPPKTAAEAQAQLRFESGRVQLAMPAFDALQQQLDARIAAIRAKQESAAAEGQKAAQGMQSDLSAAAGEDISSPEFQAKLEKMSDAEKMAFAMKMSGQMQQTMGKSYGGASFAGAEPAPVQAAQRAFQGYQQALGAQYAEAAQPGSSTMLPVQIEQAHHALDERLSREAAVCVAGGSGAQVQSCLQAKSAACWSQHASLASTQLAQLQKVYAQDLSRARKAALDADRVLAPAQYGAAATSFNGRTQLYAYQGQILDQTGPLIALSKAAYLSGAWSAGAAASGGQPLYISGGGNPSCGYEARFGRDGSSGGRSGSSRPMTPAGKATKTVQDGAKKVLNWLGH